MSNRSEAKRDQKKAELCILALVLLVSILSAILIVQLRANSLYLVDIYPDLKTPSNIPRLYLEIDDGTDTLPSEIKDPNQISKICNLLSNVELSYHGDYSGMQYYPSKGDFIIAIYIFTPNTINLYIKQDGTVCDSTSQYHAKGDTIKEFYQYILENYHIP